MSIDGLTERASRALAPAAVTPAVMRTAGGAVLAAVTAAAGATLAIVVADTIAVGIHKARAGAVGPGAVVAHAIAVFVHVAGAGAGSGATTRRVTGRRGIIGSRLAGQSCAMVANTITVSVDKGIAGALRTFGVVITALGGTPLPSLRCAVVALLHGRRGGAVVDALRAGRKGGESDSGNAECYHQGDDNGER